MNDTVYSLVCPECDAYMDLVQSEHVKLLDKSIHDYCCPVCNKSTIVHILDT